MERSTHPEDINRPNRSLVEFASWRLVAEMCRRYPDRLRVAELHPGGGMYDCLALIDPAGKQRVLINRVGSICVFTNDGREVRPWGSAWPQALCMVDDPKFCLDALCEALEWPVPNAAPPTTKASLVYRFMAEFLTQGCLSRRHWEWRNGFHDSSGYGSGKAEKWFELFPMANESARRRDANDLMEQTEYRFWFLMERDRDEPALCLETTGVAFLKAGTEKNLFSEYQKQRRIWPIIFDVVPELLP